MRRGGESLLASPSVKPRSWLFAAVVAAAAGVRLYRLDHFSLWLDEIMQSYWAHGSWTFFWESLRVDANHPPLDFLACRAVAAAGAPDWMLRLPPVLWGTATVAVFGVLVGRRTTPRAGVAAAALLAFAPFHVRYSQEVRPYALGLLLLTLSLLFLDRTIERPRPGAIAALFVCTVGTFYTLYVAAVTLIVAGLGLLISDAAAAPGTRRENARRLLRFSPLFGAAVVLAYLPWWTVAVEAARRPPPAEATPITLDGALRTLGFFAFASGDGQPLGWAGAIYLLLGATGAVLALAAPGARLFAIWAIGGFAAIEVLSQIHPHFTATRRFLPAGLGLVALAAIGLARLADAPLGRAPAAVLLALFLVADARALRTYFAEGRVDWRPIAGFLRKNAAPTDRILARDAYQRLCLAYYVVGPGFLERLTRQNAMEREIYPLEGTRIGLATAWPSGRDAWLVLYGSDPAAASVRRWASPFSKWDFPKAEGSTVFRLDALRRDAALGREGGDAFASSP